MARFIITNGSLFDPYTYDELVKPLEQATQAHIQQQEALDALGYQAEEIGAQIGNAEDDAEARSIYDTYMKMYDDTANELYNNGISAVTANNFSKARRYFAKNMLRVNNALQNRRDAIAEYRKKIEADPTLITEDSPANYGVDNWLYNEDFGHFKSYSGNELQKQAATLGQNLRRGLLRQIDEMKKEFGSEYVDQYFTDAHMDGYTAEELEQAIMNIRNGERSQNNPFVNALENAILQVYGNSGMANWENAGDIRDKVLSNIGTGLATVIGQPAVEYIKNLNFASDIDWHKARQGDRSLDLQERGVNLDFDKFQYQKEKDDREFQLKEREFELEDWIAHDRSDQDWAKIGLSASNSDPYGGKNGEHYDVPTITTGEKGDLANAWVKDWNSTFGKFKDQVGRGNIASSIVFQRPVQDANGQYRLEDVVVDDWLSATKLYYESDFREDLRSRLGGIDVGVDPSNYGKKKDRVYYSIVDSQGDVYVAYIAPKDGKDHSGKLTEDDVAVFVDDGEGRFIISDALTDFYRNNRKEYLNRVAANEARYSSIKDVAVSPDDEFKIRKKWESDPSIRTENIVDAINSRTDVYQGQTRSALLSEETAPDFIKQAGAALLYSYGANGDKLNVYRIDKDNKVDTKYSKGNDLIKENNGEKEPAIKAIVFNPGLLMKGKGLLTVQTNSGNLYAVPASYFGDGVQNYVTEMQVAMGNIEKLLNDAYSYGFLDVNNKNLIEYTKDLNENLSIVGGENGERVFSGKMTPAEVKELVGSWTNRAELRNMMVDTIKNRIMGLMIQTSDNKNLKNLK